MGVVSVLTRSTARAGLPSAKKRFSHPSRAPSCPSVKNTSLAFLTSCYIHSLFIGGNGGNGGGCTPAADTRTSRPASLWFSTEECRLRKSTPAANAARAPVFGAVSAGGAVLAGRAYAGGRASAGTKRQGRGDESEDEENDSGEHKSRIMPTLSAGDNQGLPSTARHIPAKMSRGCSCGASL